MRDRIMRAAGVVFCATVAFMPISALAFDVNKASSNFDLVSLSDAELSARSLKTVDTGNVELTSGHIVAADPLAQPDRPAFARTVFAEGKPDHWELATLPGQDVVLLKDDEIFGYPVDAGFGSYMDAGTLVLIGQRERQVQAQKPDSDVNYYDDVIASELDANKGVYALHRPMDGKKGNVAINDRGRAHA